MRITNTKIPSAFRSALLYFVLGAAAFVCYLFPFHFFYQLSIMFGSIFLFITAQRFSLLLTVLQIAGVHIAAMSMPETQIHVFHTAELIAVVLLAQLFKKNRLMLYDGLYWLIVGVPILIGAHLFRGMPVYTELQLFTFAMVINGLFNAMVAEIIVKYVPALQKKPTNQSMMLTMPQIILHVNFFGLVSMALMILVTGGQAMEQQAKKDIVSSLRDTNLSMKQIIQSYSSQQLRDLHLRNVILMEETKGSLLKQADPKGHGVVMLDKRGLILSVPDIPGSPPWLRPEQWEFDKNNLYLSLPSRGVLLADNGSRWKEAAYIHMVEVDSFVLYFRWPLNKYYMDLYVSYSLQFQNVLYIAGFMLLLVFFLHKVLVRSIRNLIDATTDIPTKLINGERLQLPSNRLYEIQLITDNIRSISGKLGDMLSQSRVLAYYDTLTGLPNRRNFNEHLQNLFSTTAADSEVSVAVMFIDLDRFKQINDTLGHGVGDSLLKQVGQRLERYIGQNGMVARLGGDEFVIVVSPAEESEIHVIARKALEAISEPVRVDEHELLIVGSIGISIAPTDGNDMDTIIKKADSAMYAAKGAGGDTYHFFSSVDARSHAEFFSERMFIEFELRKAFEARELELYYQPVIDAKSQTVVSAEALLRWRHKEWGMVSPAKFIPVAESMGIMGALGEWVLEEACRQNKAWMDDGVGELRIAVNLSPTQFNKGTFVQMIHEVLQKTGLPPRMLDLEITEEVLAKQTETMKADLNLLKKQGVRIWIDDFGTGYSSLSMLNKLPVNGFKIDQSFVRNLQNQPGNVSIIRAIVQLAHIQGWGLIAEGVETSEESLILSSLGCAEHQGYFYGKPMPPEQFAQYIRERMASEKEGDLDE
ncbi:putative bifunctional diguanylate cyclase/phosphodiesterase [Paenibacillus turpanensis]|uniref:putative bifunctional diguanylate cyclase/phosphodiesterase n=1 Tax=Paenibacillus turpanensis TaxID=2689078 RepID=UPI001408B628|nr:EAL domain-containing protein [Paenibacillus turpanensis]